MKPDDFKSAIEAELLETDLLAQVLDTARKFPGVAWVERMNVGGASYPNKQGKQQYVRFGFAGMSDLIGQMKRAHGGAFLAIEVKRVGNRPTEQQQAFLDVVTANGGVAFWCTSPAECWHKLALGCALEKYPHAR
jgi:hypothetical protein